MQFSEVRIEHFVFVFTLCYLRLRFVFAHNRLYRSWWCCRSGIVWTLSLSPVQPICCDKKNRSRNQKKNAQCEWILRVSFKIGSIVHVFSCVNPVGFSFFLITSGDFHPGSKHSQEMTTKTIRSTGTPYFANFLFSYPSSTQQAFKNTSTFCPSC